MTRALWFLRPVRIPAAAIVLLALSATAGNMVQWQQRGDLQAQADANNVEAECRSRIVGYVEGLSIELSVAEVFGLLEATGAEDLPVSRQEAVERATAAAGRLETAKDYRERSVQVCANNPGFDPTSDIPVP